MKLENKRTYLEGPDGAKLQNFNSKRLNVEAKIYQERVKNMLNSQNSSAPLSSTDLGSSQVATAKTLVGRGSFTFEEALRIQKNEMATREKPLIAKSITMAKSIVSTTYTKRANSSTQIHKVSRPGLAQLRNSEAQGLPRTSFASHKSRFAKPTKQTLEDCSKKVYTSQPAVPRRNIQYFRKSALIGPNPEKDKLWNIGHDEYRTVERHPEEEMPLQSILHQFKPQATGDSFFLTQTQQTNIPGNRSHGGESALSHNFRDINPMQTTTEMFRYGVRPEASEVPSTMADRVQSVAYLSNTRDQILVSREMAIESDSYHLQSGQQSNRIGRHATAEGGFRTRGRRAVTTEKIFSLLSAENRLDQRRKSGAEFTTNSLRKESAGQISVIKAEEIEQSMSSKIQVRDLIRAQRERSENNISTSNTFSLTQLKPKILSGQPTMGQIYPVKSIENLTAPAKRKKKVLESIMRQNLNREISKEQAPYEIDMKNKVQEDYNRRFRERKQQIQDTLQPRQYRVESDLSYVELNSGKKASQPYSAAMTSALVESQILMSYEEEEELRSDPISPISGSKASELTEDRAILEAEVEEIKQAPELQRMQRVDNQKDDILPFGLTGKALFDDKLYAQWYQKAFCKPADNFEQMVRKQMRIDRRTKKIEKLKQEAKKKAIEAEKDASDASFESYYSEDMDQKLEIDHASTISGENSNSRDNTLQPNSDNEMYQENLHERIESMMEKKRQNAKKASIRANRRKKMWAGEDTDYLENDSEDSLDEVELKRLMKDVRNKEVGHVIEYDEVMEERLKCFKVKIRDAETKLKNKQKRLLRYYFREFFKYLREQKLWAFSQKDKQDDSKLNTNRKKYEAKLEREEQDLKTFMSKLGSREDQEMLFRMFLYKGLYKLMDTESEVKTVEFLDKEQKIISKLEQGSALDLESRKYQLEMQPVSRLREVSLAPDQRENFSPQKQLVSSLYSKELIREVKETEKERIANKQAENRRQGLSGNYWLETQHMISNFQKLQKQKSDATGGDHRESFKKTAKQRMSYAPKPLGDIKSTVLDGMSEGLKMFSIGLRKKLSEKISENELMELEEKFMARENARKLEVYHESKLKNQYVNSIKLDQNNAQDVDSKIHAQYERDCKHENSVYDVPVFAKIKNKTLKLVNYELNSGLCNAMCQYLKSSNFRLNQSFLIRNLHLEDNKLADSDFAKIVEGLNEQLHLTSLYYARNEFGIKSVEQLSLLVDNQLVTGQTANTGQINQIHLKNVRTDFAVMEGLSRCVLMKVPYLNQLKIQNINLNNSRLVNSLAEVILIQKKNIQLIDLADCQLQENQLELLTLNITKCDKLSMLSLADNNLRKDGPIKKKVVQNIVDLIEGRYEDSELDPPQRTCEPILNHLNVSGMTLEFNAVQQIIKAIGTSKSVCGIHIGRNKLEQSQKEFICRMLGVKRERVGEASNPITVEKLNSALDKVENVTINRQNTSGKEKSYPLHHIVNSQLRRGSMFEQHVAEEQNLSFNSLKIIDETMIFTRQIYNPELILESGGLMDNLAEFNSKGPFQWKLVERADQCYICMSWRYCILFYSRTHVVDSEFFKPVTDRQTLVELDKQCGFYGRRKETKEPILLGSLTNMNKVRLVKAQYFIQLLNERLKNAKAPKMANQQKVIEAFRKRLDELENEDIAEKEETHALDLSRLKTVSIKSPRGAPTAKLDIRKATTMNAMTLDKFHALQKIETFQNIQHSDSSSDVSLNNESDYLEILSKLQKNQTDVLVLNLNYENPYNVFKYRGDSGSSDDEPDSMSENDHEETDVYVFAGFIPPGKHTIVIRDHDNNIIQQHHTLTHMKTQLPTIHEGQQQSDASLGRRGSILRASTYTESNSQYYYKKIAIDPRKNLNIKGHQKSFKFGDLKFHKKKPRETRTKGSRDYSDEKIAPKVPDGVFRDWMYQTEQTRFLIVESKIGDSVVLETERLHKDDAKKKLFKLSDESLEKMWESMENNFDSLLEFYYEVAATRELTYPNVDLNQFAVTCESHGVGHLSMDAQDESNLKYSEVVSSVKKTITNEVSSSNLRLYDTNIDFLSFHYHLVKLAHVLAERKTDVTVSEIYEQIVTRDVPVLRRNLAMANRTISQVLTTCPSAYEPKDLIDTDLVTSEDYRKDSIHFDSQTLQVLEKYQDSLFQIYMTVSSPAANNMLHCQTAVTVIQNALSLSAFRAFKAPTKPPKLANILAAFKQAEPYLSKETILTCLVKSKMLVNLSSVDPSKLSKVQKMAEISNVDMKTLSFVEYLEFIVRLCMAVFSFSAKQVKTAKGAVLKRLIEFSERPFANQLCLFLDSFLKQMVLQHASAHKDEVSFKTKLLPQLQIIYQEIPKLEDPTQTGDD